MILVGSRALKLRAGAVLDRDPRDFDFIGFEPEVEAWLPRVGGKQYREGNKIIAEGETPCEFELITPGASNELLCDLVAGDSIETSFGLVPSLDLLFTLKTSHRHKKNSPHFWKTLRDYHRMKAAGAKVRPEYTEFLKLREKETYNYAHPNLMQKKTGFFTDNVKYTYDHDSIHEAVALQDKPAYRYFAKENEEVFSSKQKFLEQSREIQLNSVVEESAVLAIERSLVPFPGAMTHKQAWQFAFSKVCTSIASGWWRAFAYENAPAILKMYPEGYYENFQRGLTSGIVKLA